MSTTPHLLDRLASLTSIRDVEILEFSLLKTLNEMFRPEQLLLLKLDAFGQRSSTLRYVSEGDALTTVSTQHPDHPEIDYALRMAQRINGPYHTQLTNGHFLSAYPVLDMRMLNICLVTQSLQMATPQDTRLIQGFLQVYRNFCVLLEESQHDQLTGLLNRKTFDANIQRLIAMSESLRSGSRSQDERRHQPHPHQTQQHWLCMVDIDHFKTINDRFGHIYGDEVLVWLGQLMRETFREEDLIFRFGGEEFVVITENMDLASARGLRAFPGKGRRVPLPADSAGYRELRGGTHHTRHLCPHAARSGRSGALLRQAQRTQPGLLLRGAGRKRRDLAHRTRHRRDRSVLNQRGLSARRAGAAGRAARVSRPAWPPCTATRCRGQNTAPRGP